MGRRSDRVGRISVRQAAEIYHMRPGYTLADVGKVAGVSGAGVRKAFIRCGLPLKPNRNTTWKIRRSDFERARRKGWTKAQLARELGVDRNTVYGAQKRFGFVWPERDGMKDNRRAKR